VTGMPPNGIGRPESLNRLSPVVHSAPDRVPAYARVVTSPKYNPDRAAGSSPSLTLGRQRYLDQDCGVGAACGFDAGAPIIVAASRRNTDPLNSSRAVPALSAGGRYRLKAVARNAPWAIAAPNRVSVGTEADRSGAYLPDR